MICASCNVPMDEPSDICPICGYSALLLDRYRLLYIIRDDGDSGTLFRAMDTEGERAVVVRELPLHVLSEDEDVALCEAAYASLHGVSIPGMAYWRDRKLVGRRRTRTLYAVQDYVQGQPLTKTIRGPLSVPEALAILDEVLSVLEVMHEHTPPLLHRDLKPDNILRKADGSLVLVDAGGARDVVLGARIAKGALPNAGRWLAPEQLRGEGGAACDIYAVGLLLLFLLTGKTPDAFTSPQGKLDWEETAVIDRGVFPLLTRMLRRQPATRPSGIPNLRAQLRELMEMSVAGEEQPTMERADTFGETQGETQEETQEEIHEETLDEPSPPSPQPPAPQVAAPVIRSTATRISAAVVMSAGVTGAAALYGGPIAASVVGGLTGLSTLIYARSVRAAPLEIPWVNPPNPNTSETIEMFQEAVVLLEEAYPTPPPALVRIRDYVSNQDYGALRMDIPRLRNQLVQHHRSKDSEVPPVVEASLSRLQVLSQLNS